MKEWRERERVVAKVEESLPLSTHLSISLSLSLSTKQKQTSILEMICFIVLTPRTKLIQIDLNNYQTKKYSDWVENFGYKTHSVWKYQSNSGIEKIAGLRKFCTLTFPNKLLI